MPDDVAAASADSCVTHCLSCALILTALGRRHLLAVWLPVQAVCAAVAVRVHAPGAAVPPAPLRASRLARLTARRVAAGSIAAGLQRCPRLGHLLLHVLLLCCCKVRLRLHSCLWLLLLVAECMLSKPATAATLQTSTCLPGLRVHWRCGSRGRTQRWLF